jgi:hypothetical protein
VKLYRIKQVNPSYDSFVLAVEDEDVVRNTYYDEVWEKHFHIREARLGIKGVVVASYVEHGSVAT